MMLALAAGTLLAIAALCYVLYPLFFGVVPNRPRAAHIVDASPREEAVSVLREIEFDRETGKLADDDYAELKTAWTQRALEAMRAEDAPGAAVATSTAAVPASVADAAELAIRRARANAPTCPVDGPRPEPDAAYCSDCGRWLAGSCTACGAAVEGEGARFCTGCGSALQAA